MPEPDFESILKKYRSLLGPGHQEEDHPGALPQGQAQQKQASSSEASSASSLDERPLTKEDAYLEADRFIRAPLSNEKLDPPSSDIYNNLLFNNLFAAEDGSWDNPASFVRSVSAQEKVEIDPQAAEYARKLYHYEMDLRQNYNPELGMYPGQAVYVPRHTSDRHRKEVKEEKPQPLDIGPDFAKEDPTMNPPAPRDLST